MPECIACHDEYSNKIVGKKSSFLKCGHLVCTQCHREKNGWLHITCPVCRDCSPRQTNPENNLFNDFLDEFAEMIQQMEKTCGRTPSGGTMRERTGSASTGHGFNGMMHGQMEETSRGTTLGGLTDGRTPMRGRPFLRDGGTSSGVATSGATPFGGFTTTSEATTFGETMHSRSGMIQQMEAQHQRTCSCDDCQKMSDVDEMFHCPECSSKSCGYCAYTRHQGHEAIPLLKMEVGEVSKDLQNVCKTYKGLFPKLHKQLLDDMDAFEMKLSLEERIFKDHSSAAFLKEERETFRKLKTDFEAMAEEYLPELRKIDTKVKKLIQALHHSHNTNE